MDNLPRTPIKTPPHSTTNPPEAPKKTQHKPIDLTTINKDVIRKLKFTE